jgi:DNA-binding transcriptional regulator YhcF (GntR family)
MCTGRSSRTDPQGRPGELILRTSPTRAMLGLVIDPDSELPPYEQLAVILRDEIMQGNLSGRIPSVHAISERHHVSHRIAARALTVLKGEGMIVSLPGKGHYVRERS